ncbi:MAG: coproporphyrinogen III oxidase [Sphingomonadaceae bacterium]|nr:coproporphyrinogen III oxidase [Sphingomonadaceae bacterium]
MSQEPLALYVHWPFCVSKCPYCDFNSHVRDHVDQAAWRQAMLADLRHEAALLPGRALGSIFFGGGTPSLMPPDTVAAIIDTAAGAWQMADDVEITLEANPNSVEVANFAALAGAGVNRISIGIQSFDDDSLVFLGRAHSADEGLAAIATAQRHFARVSFDLITARPGQTLAAWQGELRRALSLGTEHLSLYQLTIEPGTRFKTLFDKGEICLPDEDLAADLFAATREMTAAAGLPAYEISNHARPGCASRHNLSYWRYLDYAGIGPGAHGRRAGQATQRHKKPENWLKSVENSGHGLCLEGALSPEARAMEALVMGLRLTEGVDLAHIAARTNMPVDALIDAAACDQMVALGLVHRDGAHLALSEAGMPLLDAILPKLVAPAAAP